MTKQRKITLQIKLNDRNTESETTCSWIGPYILGIVTVLPEPGLAVEVNSTFLGHEGVPTCATHLTLGPVGHAPSITTAEHEHTSLNPTIRARECAYEHTQAVLEALKDLGYQVSVNIDDRAFIELERVER